ncbi:MAG TPA: GNAT family N-acetyltransferase [Janthinobacterium sp.]|nr:GNAT family N-acetyltransferase [Janthinobacterium sp.]
MDTLTLRLAEPGDAPAISALIGQVMPYLTLHPDGEGAETFRQSMAPAAIAGYIGAGNVHYQMGFIGAELAGVVALRDRRHLFHLFVAPAFQRRGIGRLLWQAGKEAAIAAGNTQGFTVNSSVHAAAMYQRFGFVASGPRVEQHGIAYIPMQLTAGR